MNKRILLGTLGLTVLMNTAFYAPLTWADEQAAEAERPEKKRTTHDPNNRMGFPDLVGGLLATEGVIDAMGARTADGKTLVIGWFEDKDAVKRWYHSEMHQGMLNVFFPERDHDREPLFKVPDDTEPIMVIASLTIKPGEPISQISVELYTPLHGGFAHNGLFGPDSFKDRFMHYDQFDLTGKKDDEAETEDTAEGEKKAY